jgi:hypothetical protein
VSKSLPFVAVIEDRSGRLVPVVRDREQFDGFIQRKFELGEQVWVTVTKPSKDRTNQQFRYLYSCVYPQMSEELGCTVDEIDGIMRKKFLTMNKDTPLEYVKNKTDLDRQELARFIDDVRMCAAGMGIQTQDPLGG